MEISVGEMGCARSGCCGSEGDGGSGDLRAVASRANRPAGWRWSPTVLMVDARSGSRVSPSGRGLGRSVMNQEEITLRSAISIAFVASVCTYDDSCGSGVRRYAFRRRSRTPRVRIATPRRARWRSRKTMARRTVERVEMVGSVVVRGVQRVVSFSSVLRVES